MAQWNKILVSGSNIEVNDIIASGNVTFTNPIVNNTNGNILILSGSQNIISSVTPENFANNLVSNVSSFTQGSIIFADSDGSLTENNTQLYWDNVNNRLGIGTSSPTEKLTIVGDNNIMFTGVSLQNQPVTIGTNIYDNLTINAGLGSGKVITIGGTGRHLWLSANQFIYKNNKHIFENYLGTIQSIIDYTDDITKVGLGTSTPTETLDVNGNVKADGVLQLYDVTDTQTISLNPNGDSYILNGNVGIGTSNPERNLHVADDVRIDSDLFVRTINSQYFSSTNNLNLIYGDAANFNIYSNTTERFRITSDGNVGINTTTPTEKLDVRGVIVAGDIAATTGATSFKQFYNTTGNYLTTIGSEYSSGGFMFGYGVEPKKSSLGVISTTNVNIFRSKLQLNGDKLVLSFASLQNTPIGDDITDLEDSFIFTNDTFRFNGILKLYDITDTQTIELNPDGDSYINGGNVGIGTTSPNPHNWGRRTLTVQATGTNAYSALEAYGTGSGAGAVLFGANSIMHSSVQSINGSHLAFTTNATNSGISQTERMRILSNGNVGIGTTSPTERLHISKTDGDNELVTLRIDNNLGYSEFGTLSNYARILSNGDLLYAGALSATFFYIGNETIQTFKYFNSKGHVGIRNSNPTETLDVNGNIKADGTLKLYDVTDTQTIELNPDGDSYINGNLGIGTASPNAKMHIKAGNSGATPISQQHLILEHNSATGLGILTTSLTSGYIFFGDETNAQIGYIGYSHPTDSMIFKIAGSERIRIDSSGNVGINTTSPTERLDVVGNIKSSGYITGKRCGAAGYLASPVNITVTTANTYYPIGVFTVPVAADFIVGTTYPNGLKYTGTIAQTFHITWNATIESTSNNVSSIIYIEKNGVSIPMAKMGTYSKTGGEIYNLNGQCVVDLDVNDEIRFVVTADNNGEVLTFDYFTASIKEFFD